LLGSFILSDLILLPDGHRGRVELDPDLGLAEQRRIAAAEMRLSRDIKAVLDRHYPGHAWHVGSSLLGGVAYLSIPLLMGPIDNMVMHLDNIMDPLQLSLAVMRHGAEVLERFNIPRASLEKGLPDFLEARATKRVGINGNTATPA
jgi:hypothetical protein